MRFISAPSLQSAKRLKTYYEKLVDPFLEPNTVVQGYKTRNFQILAAIWPNKATKLGSKSAQQAGQ